MAHGVAAAEVEQARVEPRLAHRREHLARALHAHAPVLRVQALRAHVEGDAGQVGLAVDGGGDELGNVVHVRAELARERPVAADVGRVDAQVELRVGLDRLDLADLLLRVDHVPLHALGRRVLEVGARLHGVGVEDLGHRHAQREEEVELGDGGDLEAGAFLDQDLEDARVGVRLDGEVRAHPRQRRAEAPRLGAHDVQVDEEDRLLVGVPGEVLLHGAEVEADFGVGIEGKLRDGAELLDYGSGHRCLS